VSLPEVSVAAGDLSPVVVQAGEAGRSSVTRLNEVLTAPVSARARYLTIDAANLRSIDQTPAQALMPAGLIALVHGGRAVLMNPREPAREVLNCSRAAEMFTVQDQAPAQTAPEGSMDGGFSERAV
jgi:anti-anti-sigma regulatory factor